MLCVGRGICGFNFFTYANFVKMQYFPLFPLSIRVKTKAKNNVDDTAYSHLPKL